MRIYTVSRPSFEPWRAYAEAFRLISVETSDRRKARRVVRLARRLGFADVRFTTRKV